MLAKFFKQLFCRHLYKSELVFCNPPDTHSDIECCIKCDKTKVVFRGTRKAWRERHSLQ